MAGPLRRFVAYRLGEQFGVGEFDEFGRAGCRALREFEERQGLVRVLHLLVDPARRARLGHFGVFAMSKLIDRLSATLAQALRLQPADAVPSEHPADWSPVACKVLAMNLAQTTVKKSRWR